VIRSSLSRRAEFALYLFAGLSYITMGIAFKSLLNWVVGPLWVVAWVEVGARVANWRTRRSTAERAP
jgi:hypothetical protein